MASDLPPFDHEGMRAAIAVDMAMWRQRMLDDWIWSQCLVPQPLCVVTGI